MHHINDQHDVALTLRQRLAADPHRPLYHFLPPANWMNDPNGLIQWEGRYHLFYQYNPAEPRWGHIHWGHAVSDDLVNWHDLPIALAPTAGTADADGCWSGCAFDNGGTPTIMYTGGHGANQLPCLAMSYDDLLTFEKFVGNPVIASPPPELDVVGFRDHRVWRDGNMWYQTIGSGIRGVGGAALLYRSSDLVHWEYIHPLYVGNTREFDPFWSGEMWECADFFPLGDQHVLFASIFAEDSIQFYYTVYYIGEYRDLQFTPHTQGFLDVGGHVDAPRTFFDQPGERPKIGMNGGHFYAPQTFLDDQGRRIMVGWLQEGRSEAAQLAAGWSGVLSLPRVLSLDPHGGLRTEPVPELQTLRRHHHHREHLLLPAGSRHILDEIHGDCLEIKAEFWPEDAHAFGVTVRCSPDQIEQTVIVYDCKRQWLGIDCSRSSLRSDVHHDVRGGPAVPRNDGKVDLHIFVDRSVIEVFANGRSCITARVYPSRADSRGVAVFSRGGHATLSSLDVWNIAPIWDTDPSSRQHHEAHDIHRDTASLGKHTPMIKREQHS